MSQKWFRISIIVLVIVICTFLSSVKHTFGMDCLRRTNKGKDPTVIDDAIYVDDLKELDTMVDRHNELYRDEPGKAKSINNLKIFGFQESKKKHIQCTNCVILRYYLKQLQWIVDGLIRGDHTDSRQFTRDLNSMKNHVVQMLSLLYALNSIDVQHWLYTFFFKISAVQSWSENKRLVIDHLENYTDLDMVLSGFITLCLHKSYLPVNTRFDYGMPLTKSNSYAIRETVFRPLYDNRVFHKTRQYLWWFTVENLYLTGLWGKEAGLFVGNVPGISLDWRPVQTRLAEHKAKIEEFYTENQWVYDPYRCGHYHYVIANLIDVRLYSYVCVHLYVYITLQNCGTVDEPTADGQQNDYREYNTRFQQQLSKAFKFSQFGDRFAKITLKNLLEITCDYNVNNAYTALMDVVTRIHKLLVVVAPKQVESIMTVEAEDFSKELLEKNLIGLTEFTATLKKEIHPIDLNFVQTFMKASRQDHVQFFAK